LHVNLVYLRNVHPKQIIHLPVAPGWCRVLRPAVTTRVSERVLHLPAVRQLLIGQLIEIVDGAAWDPDIRQRRASRIDMARAIAQAEQREFDALRARRPDRAEPRRAYRKQDKRLRKPRADQWTPELIEQLRQGCAAGLTWVAIAGELGRTPGACYEQVRRLGLKGSSGPASR
jgi:hypothetical protein